MGNKNTVEEIQLKVEFNLKTGKSPKREFL
jgi:hypothetical protein